MKESPSWSAGHGILILSRNSVLSQKNSVPTPRAYSGTSVLMLSSHILSAFLSDFFLDFVTKIFCAVGVSIDLYLQQMNTNKTEVPKISNKHLERTRPYLDVILWDEVLTWLDKPKPKSQHSVTWSPVTFLNFCSVSSCLPLDRKVRGWRQITSVGVWTLTLSSYAKQDRHIRIHLLLLFRAEKIIDLLFIESFRYLGWSQLVSQRRSCSIDAFTFHMEQEQFIFIVTARKAQRSNMNLVATWNSLLSVKWLESKTLCSSSCSAEA